MLEYIQGRASDRKLRLFACACCRLVWSGLTYGRSRLAVEVAERYADGAAGDADLERAYSTAQEAVNRCRVRVTGGRLVNRRGVSVEEARLSMAAEAAHVNRPFRIGRLRWFERDDDVRPTSPGLLRDIFGNQFRPETADPRWLTSTAVALARTIYEERAFDRLPILADALEDAGCDNADILTHCRGDGPHVRGCWVTDLVLGKK